MSPKTARFGAILKILKRIGSKTGFLILLLLAFGLGYLFKGSPPSDSTPRAADSPGQAASKTAKEEIWTCSMHPQIQLSKPGKCPICGMNLILATGDSDSDEVNPRRFTTSEAAKALMDIQTALVERRFVTAEIRMVGKVDYDETKLGYLTAWVPGRLDRLYVDYTGVEVRKGDHMVYLYSPELLTGQDELLRAAEAVARLRPDAPEVMKNTAQATLVAARTKLRLWGLTDSQVKEAEKTGIASDHVTIYAPMGGTVIHKNGQEGMYVDTGTRIYTIADLTSVWVKLDAYESDLAWLHYGQKVTFYTEAYPGQVFEGRIAFIDPMLDSATRTVKVRVNVPNADGRLKPEMFVRAVVRADIASGGRVMDPGIAGKWIGPMHPEIIKDGPGTCDICGMALVKAEDLGYVSLEAVEHEKPLVIPASAPLRTGTRAVVYVEVPDTERPTFEGREVVLGSRAGDYYIVKSGLREGERVVTNGNFKIDSALQILAKPSMMSPEGGGGGGGHDHGGGMKPAAQRDADSSRESRDAASLEVAAPEVFQTQLGKLYESYLGIHAALAGDQYEQAATAVETAGASLEAIDMKPLTGDAHMAWMESLAALREALEAMEKAEDIEAQRTGMAALSGGLSAAVETFGIISESPAFKAHCPMAQGGKGADWLQADTEIRNPYYGSMMPSCGDIVGRIEGRAANGASVTDDSKGADPSNATEGMQGHEGSDHKGS